MQLLFAHSEEGDTEGLGLLAGTVRHLPGSVERPVPHMGWNTCQLRQPDPLLAGIGERDYFYFVHSYAAAVGPCTSAVVEYGAPLTAVVHQGNLHGVQFHPERSGAPGARVLRNFLDL
jgi:glutamine amidotransferase